MRALSLGLLAGVLWLQCRAALPDTVLLIGQFDHWKTPYAKDLGLPSLNSLTDLSLKLTDGTGSSSDVMRVRLKRASTGEVIQMPAKEAA